MQCKTPRARASPGAARARGGRRSPEAARAGGEAGPMTRRGLAGDGLSRRCVGGPASTREDLASALMMEPSVSRSTAPSGVIPRRGRIGAGAVASRAWATPARTRAIGASTADNRTC